ncbi:MAG: S-layer homology domain-containing protein [Clostridia bacterium]|nr:S-layer homology domain-containing protein [Clostridia bacterium]
MRKVLSFVLVLALVLGSVSMAFAVPADVAGTDSEEAVNVLMEFGVVTGYSDGSFKPGNVVTRAEMAAFIVRALGLNPNAAAATQFSDVPASHWASKFVVYAASLGIIMGRTATMFDPDATVSYDEAVTMLVRALGYTEASLNGVYPAAFVSKAKALGIIGDIQAGTAGANRGDIAQLVFNTLSCDIGKVNAENTWVISNPLDTMMDRLGATKYTPAGGAAGDAFLVTKDLADAAVANIRGLVGAWVTAYENSDGDIIAIKEVKSVFLTGKVIANGKFKADGVEYSYDSAITKTTAAGISNGEFVGAAGYGIKPATTHTLAVKVSGKTIQDVYSVSKWDTTQVGFFADSDADDIANDSELFGISFPLDDNRDIDLSKFDLLGADSLEDIPEDSVVYVYALNDNQNNDISRIEVSTEVITGQVTRVSGTDYTIASTVYSAATILDGDSIVPLAKDEVSAYLDYAGDVYKFEKISGNTDKFAVVINLANEIAGLNGDSAKIKLILADGTVKTFAAVSGDVAVGILNAAGAWQATITSGSIIKYSVDADGAIDQIVTTASVKAVNTSDITKAGSLEGLMINSDAVVFTAVTVVAIGNSASGTDSDDYGVGTLDSILGAENVNAVYVVKDGKITAILIQSDATTDSEVYGVVTDRASNMSDAGYEVDMLVAGSPVTYNAKLAAYNTAAVNTAIYLITFDTSNNVKTLEALADANTYSYTRATTTDNAFAVSGKVVSFTTAAAVTNGALVETAVTVPATTSALTLASNCVIYVWNATELEYEVGNAWDLEKVNTTAIFYDVVDGDLLIDLVKIN